jgi:hypothetical protein
MLCTFIVNPSFNFIRVGLLRIFFSVLNLIVPGLRGSETLGRQFFKLDCAFQT